MGVLKAIAGLLLVTLGFVGLLTAACGGLVREANIAITGIVLCVVAWLGLSSTWLSGKKRKQPAAWENSGGTEENRNNRG